MAWADLEDIVRIPRRWPATGGFDNDVVVPVFSLPGNSFAGSQRKGIQDLIGPKPSPVEHAAAALAAVFPLSVPAPLPQDVLDAVDFVAREDPAVVREFWASQLGKLRDLVSGLETVNTEWGDLIPEGCRPAAGTVKVPALNALLNKFALGGLNWSSQFISGFGIYGSFSQDQAYFPSDKPIPPPCPWNRCVNLWWNDSLAGHLARLRIGR
jgi:hypothetical protein